ncbi:hypothetical protein UFOVP820_43 [uncultured Caudovirales phage]|uniref:Holin n=1 Tax=uncultured Caudovirales phage TaxID=2100421 RepID=A0A6J5P7J0_9CAUD|nr:hypothetical protein UFOVP820_43 [uncultured Caudovirales phage]
MATYIKTFLGTSFSKVTTIVAIAVTVLGVFADAILPGVAQLVNELSPGHAMAVGAALTWVGRIRGILKEVKAQLDAAE